MARSVKPYYKNKRDFKRAYKAIRKWSKNPFSEEGAKQVPRIGYSINGPEFHQMVREMKKDAELVEILVSKIDLGKLLSNKKYLSNLPKGTVGYEYNLFANRDGITPAYILAGLCFRDGHYDALVDWSEDAKYLISRVGFTHDLMHLFTGYGTDLVGEVLLIPYTVAADGMPRFMSYPLVSAWALFGYFSLKPKVGILKWFGLNYEAISRAFRVSRKYKVAQVPYEYLIDLPLEEARKKIGLPELKYKELTDGKGNLKTSGWIGEGTLGKKILKRLNSSKQDEVPEEIIKVVTLVSNGFSLYEVFRAPDENIRQAFELFKKNSDRELVRRALENF